MIMTFLKVQQFCSGFALGLFAIGLLPQSSFAQSTNQCDLSGAIATIINRPENQKAYWGIAVQNIETDQLIYANNAEKTFTPASTHKLLTTAAALAYFGSDYQFKTPIYTVGNAPHLEKLIIKGVGNPTLTTQQLKNSLALLQTKGINHIDEIIVDDSYFQKSSINPTWEWSDLPWYYATSVNSLILNENIVTVTVSPNEIGKPAIIEWSDAIAARQWNLQSSLMTTDTGEMRPTEPTQTYGSNELITTGELSVDAEPQNWFLAIPDPSQYAVETTAKLLLESGISINTMSVYHVEYPLDQAQLFTIIPSDSLGEIIRQTNQDSRNLFAESLRQILMSEAQNIPDLLTDLGVDPNNYRLRDGSGLSRHNLATPMTFVQVLDGMAAHSEAAAYQNSLAIAATSGTLSRRFQDTPITGNFFGKTGSMTNVGALSGYLNIDGDRPIALSILVNQSEQSGSVIRRGIDDVVGAIYDWGQCGGDRP
ncbi:MAG: D-alanyl-D-alanine carboxypeptidase/D-alanyl-D-alanine-endopeptidase [Limnothrix sp. RL_2_0]|nr:D-alanyl-D-alanine carboxypeptidase/D-alanyl-D-alanine-endopeptidase [Limnothrix sp. RL_2_0]